MSSKELTLSAINGIPERIPFNPFIMHMAASIIGADYCNEYCMNPDVLAKAQVKIANHFGIDHVNVSTDAYREASAWGVEIDLNSNTPVAKTYLDWKDFESIDEPDLLSAERIQTRISSVRMLNKECKESQCVVGWIEAPFAEICSIFGLMNILLIAREPDWEKILASLINRVLPVQKEFAKMQIEAGADIIGAGDSAISQIGPKRYRSISHVATRNLFSYIKKEVPVLYHVCGDNMLVDKEGNDMIELISSTGADIIDFDYQVDLETVKKKIGNKNCIRGNTNTQILGSSKYSILDVIGEVENTILKGKPDGYFMYAAGCEWPWEPLDMSIRNLSVAKTLVEKLGKY